MVRRLSRVGHRASGTAPDAWAGVSKPQWVVTLALSFWVNASRAQVVSCSGRQLVVQIHGDKRRCCVAVILPTLQSRFNFPFKLETVLILHRKNTHSASRETPKTSRFSCCSTFSQCSWMFSVVQVASILACGIGMMLRFPQQCIRFRD